MAMLTHLNEASVLFNLRRRYAAWMIYVSDPTVAMAGWDSCSMHFLGSLSSQNHKSVCFRPYEMRLSVSAPHPSIIAQLGLLGNNLI